MFKAAILTLVFGLALTASIVYFAAAGGNDCVRGQAGDGPPPGAPTPNATQLAYWPTLEQELGLYGKAGPVVNDEEFDLSGLTEQDWIDALPPEEAGAPPPTADAVGGSTALPNVACE